MLFDKCTRYLNLHIEMLHVTSEYLKACSHSTCNAHSMRIRAFTLRCALASMRIPIRICEIMAAAAVRVSGVENARVQSNVRTNGCNGLKHRTDQDENKVSWMDWSF